MIQYVKELGDTNILINAGCPGLLATLPDDSPTGGFFEDAGEVPW